MSHKAFVRSQFFAILLAVPALLGQTREPVSQSPSGDVPAQLTAEQDHQRMMDLLHIKELRRGADGSHPDAPNAPNYDESKANPFPGLPDPLLLKNGKQVKTEKDWWTKRRPEIVEDFNREIYGRVPKQTPKVNWEIVSTTNEMNGEIPVVTKKLLGHLDNSSYPLITVDIQLTLSTPAQASGPVPVMMEFGLSPEFLAAMAKRQQQQQSQQPAQLSRPPAPSGPTWQQQVLAMGWGYAVLIPTTVQADNGAGLAQGVIGLTNKGQPRKLDDWGALRAWAWGASRALDYFETDKAVDAKRVGITGHSRYGKAALITMAYDQRFAIAYVSSSGEGGAKLNRRNWGEIVENLAATGEYHWMAGNFMKYAGPLNWNDLPVDSHELIALCAPRPVFIGTGANQGDGWVDAKGMFLAAAAAGPVYRLLGKKDLGANDFPPIKTPLMDGNVAFRQHSGGHTPAPNWPTFLLFAAHHLPTAGAEPTVGASMEVALTFDDLPAHGPLPPDLNRVDIIRSIIASLRAAHAPQVYGFINAKLLEDPDNKSVLQLWREAGFPLANHTFSHMDLNANRVDAFEQDILADESTLRALMGPEDWHWLRFPYLREGDTHEKHRETIGFLQEHGYQVAEVTLDFSDYAYNEPYARCRAKNNVPAIDWLKQSYLRRAEESLLFGQIMANVVYGHQIRHVMLLHVGGFETVMLPSLLDLLKRRGVKLITLQEAERDPAYAVGPETFFPGGGTFLQGMMQARHVAPIEHSENVFEKLNALCRN